MIGDEPRPGISYVEQLTQEQQAATALIAAETGCAVPARWTDPIYDGSDWITAVSFAGLMVRYGPSVKSYAPAKSRRPQTVHEVRMPVVLQAIDSLGYKPGSLPPNKKGKREGVKSEIKECAFQIDKAVFGPGNLDKAFSNTWEWMFRTDILERDEC
jgi:hypothetical protein